MRFRELELVRYGGFADRVLDLGDGRPDLHLVVGPNEAGKSTMLQAIGDFLFGMAGQTTQGWRFGYGDLRIRAVLEHDGRTIEAVRRKGNKDTLLSPDGTPIQGDPLGSILAGVDRAVFERMFGLDHQRLREGGDAILRGRDDAARITLEAGTGVTGIGKELDRFASLATDLFKSGGSVPLVNRLMRERGEAQKLVRDSLISESRWSDHRRRLAEAEGRRTALIAEAGELEREAARLDRLGRARGPLARLAAARKEIDELGPVRDLSGDAAERLQAARSERRTAAELEAGHADDLRRTEEAVGALVQAPELIAAAEEIGGLDRQRSVIEAAEGDLGRRLAERDRADERIAAARAEARLPADVPLPGAGWRRRAAALLQERREAAVATRAAAARRAELQRARNEMAEERANLVDVRGGPDLAQAIVDLPSDWSVRSSRADAEVARRRVRADDALRALAPWGGDVAALHAFGGPAQAAAVQVARAIDDARSDALAARREADGHATDALRAENRLAALAAAGDVPTLVAVTEARVARDGLLERLVAGELEAGDALRASIGHADGLADRRYDEAERVAEHGGAMLARDAARELERGSRQRLESREAEIVALEDAWSTRLRASGFHQTVASGDYPAWLDRRARALEAESDAREAAETAETLRSEFARALANLRSVLAKLGMEPPAEDERLLAAAQAHDKGAAECAVARERLDRGVVSAERVLAAAIDAAEQNEIDGATREEALIALLAEAGLDVGSGEIGLSDALAAVESVADDVVGKAGLDRQIDGMWRDARTFATDTDALLAKLGRDPATAACPAISGLAAELRSAMAARDRLAALEDERTRLTGEAGRAVRRRESAQAEVDELMRRAGVEEEDALDGAITAANRRRTLLESVALAERELAGLDNGDGLAALGMAVAALPVDEEAAARRLIEERRAALASEREDVGRALAQAEEERRRASSESAAADAQQLVAEDDAALAAAAEAHLEAATAGALLRWVLDRHRQINQAPLVANAGELFATVTAGAFSGLRVDYGEDDRPAIRAVRPDGSGIGVEALSEGTRDQLYLALRLGAIATGPHVLPVVCDDLLITADDERSAAMLRVLSVASTRSQVLLFTHHEHLVDVARHALGEASFVLHRLNPLRVLAA